MSFKEKVLNCIDCTKSFTLTVQQQELRASNGYINDPSRCYACRQIRRDARNQSGHAGVTESPSAKYFR